MNRIPSLLLILLAMTGLLSACAKEKQAPNPVRGPVSESRILSLYDQLKTGMTREQAEAIVGKPLFEALRQRSGEEEYWYIDKPERQMESHESPWGMGGIVVTYKDGGLVDKMYNFQWVKEEHVEAYKERRNPRPSSSADSDQQERPFGKGDS